MLEGQLRYGSRADILEGKEQVLLEGKLSEIY